MVLGSSPRPVRDGAVAQLVERCPEKAGVAGSIPACAILLRPDKSGLRRIGPSGGLILIMGNRYFVYIIMSKTNGQTYTGYTTNLENRIKQHNENIGGYTKNRGPWELVWYGVFNQRHLAEDFERYLKSGSGIAFAKKRFIVT